MTTPRLPQVRISQEVIDLDGGLDLVSTSLRRSGSLIDAANFVPDIGGGYRRVGGYERFDGRPAPSAATYIKIEINDMGSVAVGSAMTGLSSSASCVVSTVGVGYVGATKVVGDFVVGETLRVAGVGVGTVASADLRGGQTLREDVSMRADAADIYRADIDSVPGSGPVRGVHAYGGKVYAWRDNAPTPVLVETDAAWSSGLANGTWTLTNSNRTAELSTSGGGINNIQSAASASSGKRYLEIVWDTSDAYGSGIRHDVGITRSSPPSSGGSGEINGIGYRRSGDIMVGGVSVLGTTALANGDVVGIAIDMATGRVWVSRNGAWVTGNPATDTSPVATIATGTYFPFASVESGAALKTTIRSKASQFSYPAPTGFTSWGFVSSTPGTVPDELRMYVSSASGWSQVQLGLELAYSAGTGSAVVAGDTITNLAGTATAVVAAVVVESGSGWSGTSGRLILSSSTGTWAASDQIRVAGSQRATAGGAAASIKPAPGGRVRCINFNFSGAATGAEMFGVDGKNRAFSFNGSVYIPIKTGSSTDTPSCVVAHRNRLIVSIFGSLFVSGPGAPTTGWSGITSTPAEIGVSDLITDLLVLPGNQGTAALAVFCLNRVSILYGSSPSDFRLDPGVPDCGAVFWTAQSIGTALYLDTDSVRDIVASQAFGNFASSSVSDMIKPALTRLAPLVTCSSTLRAMNQYRLWFSDGSGMAFRVDGGKIRSISPIKYTNPVSCIFSGDDNTGREVVYFGSDNGFVYQAEVGTSFDGANIEAWARTSFEHCKSPSAKKSWKRARADVDVQEFAEFEFGFDLDFATSDQWVGDQKSQELSGAGAIWDSTLRWESFVWDSPYLSPPVFKLDGTSVNISFSMRSNSRLSLPFALETLLVHFINRRLERGGS